MTGGSSPENDGKVDIFELEMEVIPGFSNKLSDNHKVAWVLKSLKVIEKKKKDLVSVVRISIGIQFDVLRKSEVLRGTTGKNHLSHEDKLIIKRFQHV